MTIIDIPQGFHDPQFWLAEQRAADAAAGRAEELVVYAAPSRLRVAGGTVRNRSKRGA